MIIYHLWDIVRMKSKVSVQLFGQFCLRKDDVVLNEETLHSNKLTKLLIYMIINRDRVILYQELIDIFWEGKTKNPQNALKNLMYRLRVALKAIGEEEYICTMSGAYRWNPEIEVETDYEQFEKLALEIRNETDVEKKKQLCKEAIAGYQGNISEKLGSEPWLVSKIVWYRSLFMDVAKELGKIYEKEEAWSNLEALCNDVLPADSLDEDLHYWIIKSLWGQKKNDLAMMHYENVSRMFYDSMGIHTTEKLQSIFQEIMEDAEEYEKDISYLINEMEEKKNPKGAFFCDYQNFRQIYRVEARRIYRLNMAEYILLFTLKRSGGVKRKKSADSGLIEGMNLLEKLLKELLRVGDVAARYSLNQYIVLLPACNYESGILVAERIEKAFRKNIGNKHLELNHELRELK